jgi:transcriptional regulator with XRE-family HTH domain
MDKQNYREVIGERLRDFRKDRGISMYSVSKKGGIRIDQVKAVEEGVTNYTIDVFLGYILGSELYIYFAEKTKTDDKPHDLMELIKKAISEDPL